MIDRAVITGSWDQSVLVLAAVGLVPCTFAKSVQIFQNGPEQRGKGVAKGKSQPGYR